MRPPHRATDGDREGDVQGSHTVMTDPRLQGPQSAGGEGTGTRSWQGQRGPAGPSQDSGVLGERPAPPRPTCGCPGLAQRSLVPELPSARPRGCALEGPEGRAGCPVPPPSPQPPALVCGVQVPGPVPLLCFLGRDHPGLRLATCPGHLVSTQCGFSTPTGPGRLLCGGRWVLEVPSRATRQVLTPPV